MTRAPPISFDRVAGIYDRTRGLPPEVEERVQAALRERLGTGRTLEVGIGTGRHFSTLLADPSIDLTGVDVSRRMIEVAFGRGARRLVLADGRSLPFHDGSFERAITTHLLHLSEEWRTILAQIARVTRREYLSVVEYPKEEPDLDEAYRSRGEVGGARVRPPGQSERRLALELAPDAEVEVAVVKYEAPAEARIREFEARTYVAQWEVPGPLHDEIIRELREQYRGASIHTHLRVVLTAWKIDRIRTFANESPRDPGRPPPGSGIA